MTHPVVGITGARGYVGGVLRERLAAAGHRVISLVRHPGDEDSDLREYDLAQAPDGRLLRDVDILVHCAFDTRQRRRADMWRVNVSGTRRLMEVATAAGVERTIVVSSIAAYAGTRQVYGQAKLDIELIARRHGAVVIRPGLVFGPSAGGMVGSLQRVARLPMIPIPAGGYPQYCVHEDDLADSIIRLMGDDCDVVDPLTVANAHPVTLRRIVEILAADRRPRLLAVPWKPAYLALRLAEPLLNGRLPFRADSLWGLSHPPPPPDPGPLLALGLHLRPFGST